MCEHFKCQIMWLKAVNLETLEAAEIYKRSVTKDYYPFISDLKIQKAATIFILCTFIVKNMSYTVIF